MLSLCERLLGYFWAEMPPTRGELPFCQLHHHAAVIEYADRSLLGERLYEPTLDSWFHVHLIRKPTESLKVNLIFPKTSASHFDSFSF